MRSETLATNLKSGFTFNTGHGEPHTAAYLMHKLFLQKQYFMLQIPYVQDEHNSST